MTPHLSQRVHRPLLRSMGLIGRAPLFSEAAVTGSGAATLDWFTEMGPNWLELFSALHCQLGCCTGRARGAASTHACWGCESGYRRKSVIILHRTKKLISRSALLRKASYSGSAKGLSASGRLPPKRKHQVEKLFTGLRWPVFGGNRQRKSESRAKLPTSPPPPLLQPGQ